MVSEIINISKDDLYKLIREAIRDELHEIEEISQEEQLELERLHGKIPKHSFFYSIM